MTAASEKWKVKMGLAGNEELFDERYDWGLHMYHRMYAIRDPKMFLQHIDDFAYSSAAEWVVSDNIALLGSGQGEGKRCAFADRTDDPNAPSVPLN